MSCRLNNAILDNYIGSWASPPAIPCSITILWVLSCLICSCSCRVEISLAFISFSCSWRSRCRFSSCSCLSLHRQACSFMHQTFSSYHTCLSVLLSSKEDHIWLMIFCDTAAKLLHSFLAVVSQPSFCEPEELEVPADANVGWVADVDK